MDEQIRPLTPEERKQREQEEHNGAAWPGLDDDSSDSSDIGGYDDNDN